jgi:transposase
MPGVHVERLDHLGIVAGVCREIGLAEYLDGLAGPTQQQVSIGTATVAMILNGLGFSNRRLYLVSQFFATKPVECLLGAGITAEMLHDDCLGRTLDWLHAHDPTALFAGIARQARQRFGIRVRQVHVDTTSFAVTGAYDTDLDAHTLAVTYGYSRDHRADLKQWMLALATTRAGDVPLYCQALDGNASDKLSLVAAVEALAEQLHTEDEDEAAAPIFVADSGLYSADNVTRLSAAGVRWISRVPDTSTAARAALAALAVADDPWHQDGDGALSWAAAAQAPAGERWVVVRTTAGEERARATLARQVEAARQTWEKALWHLGNRRFACAPDAAAALAQQLNKLPPWLTVQHQAIAHAKQRQAAPTRAPPHGHDTRADRLAGRGHPRGGGRGGHPRGAAHGVLPGRHQCPGHRPAHRPGAHSDLQGAAQRRARLQFSERPAVSGVLGLREEAFPHRCAQSGHGALLARVSAGRAPVAYAARRHWADGPQPAEAAHRSADDALDVPVF